MKRRIFLAGLTASSLSACGGATGARLAAPAQVARPEPVFQAVENPAFDNWLSGFRARASAAGINGSTLASLSGAGYLPDVVKRDRNQTEFRRSMEDYLAIVANDTRIGTGRAEYARLGTTLNAIEQRYGVPGHVVTAFWGVESNFGARRGNVPVLSALATLAFDGRRGAFFEKQLIAALEILQNGDVSARNMTGSWAGAMGHTQFIPTSYQLYAVDFTGDGRRDIWSNDPTDGLASTANYLARSGWQKGQPWGVEIRLPEGYSGPTGRGNRIGVDRLNALGVRLASGGAVPNYGSAQIITGNGPVFAAFRNFDAILRYNNATNYAVGVGHLSDRIRGAGPLRQGFGPDATGLTIDDRRRLQQRLTARGFDTGGSDGVIGPKTRAAIEAYQRANNLPVTGNPSPALLAGLG